jgi:hypothetical protein
MSSLHSQSRENNVDLPEGTVKEPLNEDIKTRDLSTAIQTKSDNSKTPFVQSKKKKKKRIYIYIIYNLNNIYTE